MSMSSESPGTADAPTRRTVVAYSDYANAVRAVDHLADHGFPVERVAIVGRGLEFYETVTGRMTYGKAAFYGAVQGACVGILIGWLFAIFDWFNPVVSTGWLIVDGFWFGAVVGALAGVLLHALTGGRHDFASIPGMRAQRYEVQVDAELADEATRLLQSMPEPSDVEPERPPHSPRMRMPHASH